MIVFLKNEKGQGTVEYTLICSLIVLVAMASIGSTGIAVSDKFQKSASGFKTSSSDLRKSNNNRDRERDEKSIKIDESKNNKPK